MRFLVAIFLISISNISFSQNNPDTRELFNYSITKTQTPILLDGKDDDEGWTNAHKIEKLLNHWPLDTGVSKVSTNIKLTYDDNYIYVLAVMTDNGKRIIQSLRRDDTDAHWGSESFTFVLDPYGEKQNGFLFGVNAGGAQIEGQLNVKGSQTNIDENWDNKWFSHVEQYLDHWIVEMAIPFKTIRYSTNISNWAINFIRADMDHNEYSTWTQFPRNYGGIDLNFMGSLQWDEAPKKANGKIVLVPYIAGGTNRDFEDEGQQDYNNSIDAGLDAKIAVTGALSLDLTINPDFSNVDIDQQVTNLTRFSVSFPEQRNFFLENGDIFSNFGSWGITPFFSRKIGLHEGQPVPIKYGARLTGNVTNKTRVGVMNVQTSDFKDLEPENYTVAAIHQQVLARSVIKGIFVNSESKSSGYARNGGLEFAYMSPNGKVNNTVRFHGSSTNEELNDNYYYGFDGNYNGRSLMAGWSLDFVGENYITYLGFNPRQNNYNAITDEVIRQGYTKINPWVVYRFYPKGDSKLVNHGPRTWHMAWLDKSNGSLDELSNNFAYDFIFKNTTELHLQASIRDVDLPVPTSLIGNDFTPLPVENYQFTQYWVNYNTDKRKVVSADFMIRYGDFFNGTLLNSSVGLNFRAQPWGSFGFNYDYNKVDFPSEYGQTQLHLIRMNAQISFSNTMFWTTAIQYNSQAENYNVFSRFQWRFKPMSDFFLVYTDNYTTEGLNIKNRQVVFKLTYWLNM
jgi:Domain of unknown function (DUF5916)/Carbohydrate family 9 binding domain-like